MTKPKHLKGECQHCAGPLEFPAEMAGLPAPCPHCGEQTDLLLARPPEEPAVARGTVVWAVVGIVILCLGLVGALAALTRAQRWAARQKHQSESAPPPQSLPTTESAASTPAILNTEQNGFEVSAITLESTPGTTRVYATGTLKNKTDRKRFGVKIELELLDAAEQNAGTATDYQAVMEPGAEWRYQALVVASKATSARIASIKEDQ